MYTDRGIIGLELSRIEASQLRILQTKQNDGMAMLTIHAQMISHKQMYIDYF